MTTRIALLRAINVTGHNRVAMSDLLRMLTDLGFAGGRSLLQTGNLIFQGDGRNDAELEQLLETETDKRLGIRTDYMVRTAAEWQTIVERNPFPEQAEHDPGHLVVMFLKDAPRQGTVEGLQAAIQGPEMVRADGRQAYIVYPNGIGRSKLTNALIDKHLATRGTGRNWNTVLKLADLVRA
jgi:uncharacterized protein (DUF1697 family)